MTDPARLSENDWVTMRVCKGVLTQPVGSAVPLKRPRFGGILGESSELEDCL
jgi:hypothetical protein